MTNNLKVCARQVDFRLAQEVTFRDVLLIESPDANSGRSAVDSEHSRCVRFLGLDASTDIDKDLRTAGGVFKNNSDTLFASSFLENFALIDTSKDIYEFYNCHFRGTLYIKVNGARFVNCIFDNLVTRKDMIQIE